MGKSLHAIESRPATAGRLSRSRAALLTVLDGSSITIAHRRVNEEGRGCICDGKLGHEMQVLDHTSGIQAIVRSKRGWIGGADPRREGVVKGE